AVDLRDPLVAAERAHGADVVVDERRRRAPLERRNEVLAEAPPLAQAVLGRRRTDAARDAVGDRRAVAGRPGAGDALHPKPVVDPDAALPVDGERRLGA